MRLQPEQPNHVWSFDFVQDRTADGSAYRTLNIIDEYSREALMIRVDRKLNSTDVLDALTDLFILRSPPDYRRSDNAPEVTWHFFIGGYQPAQKWLKDRKGRALSFDDIRHYQSILKILSETDKVMKTIEMEL